MSLDKCVAYFRTGKLDNGKLSLKTSLLVFDSYITYVTVNLI